jgi:hypothetical protein
LEARVFLAFKDAMLRSGGGMTPTKPVVVAPILGIIVFDPTATPVAAVAVDEPVSKPTTTAPAGAGAMKLKEQPAACPWYGVFGVKPLPEEVVLPPVGIGKSVKVTAQNKLRTSCAFTCKNSPLLSFPAPKTKVGAGMYPRAASKALVQLAITAGGITPVDKGTPFFELLRI